MSDESPLGAREELTNMQALCPIRITEFHLTKGMIVVVIVVETLAK
jgi:hypothetical protein